MKAWYSIWCCVDLNVNSLIQSSGGGLKYTKTNYENIYEHTELDINKRPLYGSLIYILDKEDLDLKDIYDQ